MDENEKQGIYFADQWKNIKSETLQTKEERRKIKREFSLLLTSYREQTLLKELSLQTAKSVHDAVETEVLRMWTIETRTATDVQPCGDSRSISGSATYSFALFEHSLSAHFQSLQADRRKVHFRTLLRTSFAAELARQQCHRLVYRELSRASPNRIHAMVSALFRFIRIHTTPSSDAYHWITILASHLLHLSPSSSSSSLSSLSSLKSDDILALEHIHFIDQICSTPINIEWISSSLISPLSLFSPDYSKWTLSTIFHFSSLLQCMLYPRPSPAQLPLPDLFRFLGFLPFHLYLHALSSLPEASIVEAYPSFSALVHSILNFLLSLPSSSTEHISRGAHKLGTWVCQLISLPTFFTDDILFDTLKILLSIPSRSFLPPIFEKIPFYHLRSLEGIEQTQRLIGETMQCPFIEFASLLTTWALQLDPVAHASVHCTLLDHIFSLRLAFPSLHDRIVSSLVTISTFSPSLTLFHIIDRYDKHRLSQPALTPPSQAHSIALFQALPFYLLRSLTPSLLHILASWLETHLSDQDPSTNLNWVTRSNYHQAIRFFPIEF